MYQYLDHLGNNRVSYAVDPADNVLKIKEENHYYPFGLKHWNYNNAEFSFQQRNAGVALMSKPPPGGGGFDPNPFVKADYNYKYNGKEWQDELGLNMYDYGARQYDPALGRWFAVDPLAEVSRRWSPYAYCYNNPMVFVDPDGMKPEDPAKNRETNESWENKPYDIADNIVNDDVAYEGGDPPPGEGTDSGYMEGTNCDGTLDGQPIIIELDQVVIEGKSTKSENGNLDNVNFVNDRVGDGADILGTTNSKGGSFRLTNGSSNGNSFSPRYYGTNWTGGSRAGIKTFNISNFIKKGSIATTVVLGTVEVGQGVVQDYENYQNTGYTNGKNTAIATARVGAGVAVGWAAGAMTGAAMGTAIPIPIVGTVFGAIVGGVAGYYASEAAGSLVEKAYE